MKPLVSIILINYNGLNDTIDCIESIKANNYDNFQIIVVDNASPDGSGITLLKKYGNDEKVKIICNKENAGFSAGNNIGIKYAVSQNADFVMLLNNDTVVEPDFLSNMLSKISSPSEKIMYTGKIKYYFEPDKIWYAGGYYNYLKGTASHRGVNQKDTAQFDNESELGFICGCYIFMSMETFYTVGFMPEEYFLYSEDLAYSIIAKTAGVKLKYIPDSVIYHKVSASTSKISQLSQYYIIRNRFYIIKKYHKGFNKFTAYLYSFMWAIKNIIKKRFKLKIFLKALHDYKNMGK